jgi:hypothetical protein
VTGINVTILIPGLGPLFKAMASILIDGLASSVRPMGSARAGVDFQDVDRVNGAEIEDGL